MRIQNTFTAFALTACFLAIAPCAAGPLAGHIEGVTATATSQHSTRVASRMVDGSGLDALGLHSTDQNNHMWDTNANKPIQFVNFNLHGNYDLGTIHVWQWDGGDASVKAAQNVEILVADTFNGPLTSLGDFVFPKGPGGGTPDPGFDIDVGGFGAADDVAQVQFIITTNWVDVDPIGNPGGGGWPMGDYSVHNNSRTGFAEVQFFEGGPDGDIPEPCTLVLAAMGLLGLGRYARRRRGTC